jgi:PAS domain S-box-containing protein
MTRLPTLDEIFAVLSAASIGDTAARVAVPDNPQLDDVATKLAIAVNLLLDDLHFRAAELDAAHKVTQMELERLVAERTEQLRQSEEKFSKAFRASPAAISIATLPDGRWIEINEAVAKMTGYSTEELIGHTSNELGLVDAVARAKILESIREQGSVRNVEIQMHTKSKEIVEVLVSVEQIELHGRPCALTIQYDITELKNAEREVRRLNYDLEQRQVALEAANHALEQANWAKDRFLASMSHELRTPLNAIIGFTGTLLMGLPGPLTAEQKKQLRTVQTSAKHLLSLISDLLDLAKIESGTVQLNHEPVVCQEVIQEIVAGLRPLAESKALALDIVLPDDIISVQADRRALSQILINLVSNAIKFTEQGMVRLNLRQYHANGQRQTEISVTDTGIGLHPEDQAKLFQAFIQVDASHTRRQEGSGLGLHLSQKLAELLGGQITVQSTYGTGSTFTLVIPEG